MTEIPAVNPPQMGPYVSRLLVANRAEVIDGYGRMLESFLRKAGVAKESVHLVHVEDAAWKQVLAAKEWKRIDAIGNDALVALTGNQRGIMNNRGRVLELEGTDRSIVMPVLSPKYLVKDQSMIPATLSDLSKGLQIPPQNYNLKPTLEDLDVILAGMSERTNLCMDIETNRFTRQITMVGIAVRPYYVTVVPFRGSYISPLQRIFKAAKSIVGQNCIQFDLQILKENAVEIQEDCQIWDIMLMHHLLHPDESHDLEYIASIYTQMQAWKHKRGQSEEWYNASDVDATMQSFEAILPILRQQNLENLYKYNQVPLAKICALMADVGLKVDPSRIKLKRTEFLAELATKEQLLPTELQPYDKSIRVRQLAPQGTLGKSGKPIKYIHVPGTERVVPWDSPKQVEKYLYETLGLPKQLHAKTKKVTSDKMALERLYRQTKNPAINAIREVRQLGELIGTFLKDGEGDKQVAVGRIHSNFLVHGTSTGRLASSGPNLQNIPSKARYIYVPSHSDWCFVEADFSSLENRLAAWYAGDTERLSRLAIPDFNEHRWLASKIYNVPESELTKDDWRYKRGKITNHGADGAMGARKLATTHDLAEKDAKELILKWREINYRSAQWQEETGNRAQRDGILVNAFGRKRWFWSHSAYTEGIRFLPQSTGADICFRAMIGMMYERIGLRFDLARKASPILCALPRPARLVLQVHDSILIEAPQVLVPEVVQCMQTVMQQPWPEMAGYSIPVDVKVGAPGASWAELKLYKQEVV